MPIEPIKGSYWVNCIFYASYPSTPERTKNNLGERLPAKDRRRDMTCEKYCPNYLSLIQREVGDPIAIHAQNRHFLIKDKEFNSIMPTP